MTETAMLEASFVGLSVLMILILGYQTRSLRLTIIYGLWCVGMWVASRFGLFDNYQTVPPRIFFVLFPTLLLVLIICLSSLGNSFVRIPAKTLILIQSFRIFVELLIHWAVELQVAPPQLTWPSFGLAEHSGLNVDILAGISALLVFAVFDRLPKWVILLWNCLGLLMVLWVVVVAILSVPSPFQILSPDNTWVSQTPYILLPTALVPIAIGGHLIIFRAILFPLEDVQQQ